MNDKDQFNWMAHEMTADLNLSTAKEQELSDILERIACDLEQTPGQFKSEIENLLPSPEGDDEGEDWKDLNLSPAI
jgi:hypothetical protein